MLSYPYWTNQRLLSAYFHYFMVWNLIRLCRLFPKLDFGTIPQKANFIDLGSGPLTIPLALFLSKKNCGKKTSRSFVPTSPPNPCISVKICLKNSAKNSPPNAHGKSKRSEPQIIKYCGKSILRFHCSPWATSSMKAMNGKRFQALNKSGKYVPKPAGFLTIREKSLRLNREQDKAPE